MNRKEAILKAAISLFAEKGFNDTPTSAVAKRAGVAEGLIFHYFKNKEGILIQILEEMINTYIQGIEAITKESKTGLEAIEYLIYFHFRFTQERSKESLVLIRDFPSDFMKPGSFTRNMIADSSARTMNLIENCIERGKKDGSIRDLPPEKTAFIIRGMLNGLSRLQMLGALAMPELTSEAVDFCTKGLQRVS